MLSIYDFKDALITLFQKETSYPIQPLSRLANKTIAVDCRYLINYMLISSSCTNIHESIKLLKSRLNKHCIKFIVVFNGIDVMDSEHFQGPAKALSNFLERHYFLKLMKKNFSENSLISNSSINSISVYTSCIEDSLAASIFQRFFEDQLVSALKEFGIEYLKSPQTRECQLGYLLKSGRVDMVMTSPIGFLFAETDEIIAEINYLDDHVRFFNFQKFCKEYHLEPDDMRKCLFACLMFFLCSKSIQHKSKLENAILQPFSNFAQTLLASNKQNATIIDSHIRSLGKVASKFDMDQAFCEFLSQIWGLKLTDILSHANLFYNSPILSNDNQIIKQENLNFSFHGDNLIDNSINSLTFWFCKQYIDHNILSLFNKCTKYTYFVCFPKIDILEMKFAFQVYFKDKLEICIGYILPTVQIDPQAEFKLNLFGENIIPLIAPRRIRNFYYLSEENSYLENSGLNSAIFQFSKALYQKEKMVQWTFKNDCDIDSVVFMLNLNLLHDIGYLNLENMTLQILGSAFLQLQESELEEEIILAFECIRCFFVHKNAFTMLTEENDRFRNEVFENLHLLMVDMNLAASNAGDADSVNGDQTSSISESFLLKIFSCEPEMNLKDLKVETLLSTPFNVIKNFELEYFKYYSYQNLKPRIISVLKNAFKNDAFQQIQFITRILFFLPCKNFIREIFDADFNHFKHLFLVIRKGLIKIGKSSLRLFAFQSSKEHDTEFLEAVLERLPFQKQKTSHMSSLIKILMQKFLIYRSLNSLNDPFAIVYKQKLELKRILTKINNDFDFMGYLKLAVKFYRKLWVFVNLIAKSGNNSDVCGIEKLMAECWTTLDEFTRFFLEN